MGITHVLLPRRTPIYAFFAVRSPGGQLKWIEYGIMPFSDCKAEHYTLLVRVHRLFATFRACERQVEVQYTFFLIVKNLKVHNLTVLRFWKICKHYVCISHSGLRNIIQNKERIKNKEANWNKTYHMCVRVCVYTSVYKLNEWSKILRQIKTISN